MVAGLPKESIRVDVNIQRAESPRSGRQHKAWGVSPRIALGKAIKAREAGGSRIFSTSVNRYGYHPLRGFD